MAFSKLIKIIESAIEDFQKKVPSIQSRIFDELQGELADLKTANGKVLSTVENLKLIGKIKNKLEAIIMDDQYVDEVKKFIKAFDSVSDYYHKYFAEFNNKFTPGATLQIIKENSIEATINGLTEAGITANIVQQISDVLTRNITSGGSIAELQNLLRDKILTNDTGQGNLERYTKQITTDAINQYSAQYNQAIAADLGLEWYMYVGSNLTTTRDWCLAMTKKKYIHKSEIPTLLKGDIDGHQVPLSPKTDIPYGMIPGTNPSNVTIYRGGYNCGHQLIAVDDAAVPQELKAKFKK